MALLRYRRHFFPPDIIQHAIWLYLRFTLSYRDGEELLAERGLDISYDTVRHWVWTGDCATAARVSAAAKRSMASLRDGDPHRRAANVPLARSRHEREGSPCARPSATPETRGRST